MAMSDGTIVPEEICRLRRSTHTFLARYGKHFWATLLASGEGPLDVPPALEALPDAQRPKALARDEAKRLSQAALFCLDAKASDLAVELGATIRTAAHPAAVMTAGHPNVVASMNIAPPASYGFLRWTNSVGYSTAGAPIIACHWGRIPEGFWLVYWADNHVVADLIGGPQRRLSGQMRDDYLKFSGPLYYEYSAVIRPHQPGSTAPSAQPLMQGPCAAEVDDDTALIYTILGTWAVLTMPGLAELTQHEPSHAEALADRRAGITSSAVTHAAGTETL
jgi:hypothetical protein